MPIEHLALVFICVSEVTRGTSVSHLPGITLDDALCHLSYLWQPPGASTNCAHSFPIQEAGHKVERSCWRWLSTDLTASISLQENIFSSQNTSDPLRSHRYDRLRTVIGGIGISQVCFVTPELLRRWQIWVCTDTGCSLLTGLNQTHSCLLQSQIQVCARGEMTSCTDAFKHTCHIAMFFTIQNI